MILKTIKSEPAYLSGAFFSQAGNLSQSMNRSQRQDTCFLATIACFIKKQDATCYASPETLLTTYNKHAHKFGLKVIKRTTMFTIQKRVLNLGLISNALEHDIDKGRNWRKFALNIDLIAVLFSSVINQAGHRAKAYLSRKLDRNRSQESTTKESSTDAGSSATGNVQNCTKTTKESKDLRRNKNKTPAGTFFKKRFKQDCDLAYQLQEQARTGSITAAGAKLLMSLHGKHGVYLAPEFKSFLNYRIINAPEQAQQPSKTEALRSKYRLQAALELRQGGHDDSYEAELLALVAERPEPSRAQKSKQLCQGILERRGSSVQPLQSQSGLSVVSPDASTKPHRLSDQIERIKNKIKKG